MDSPQSDDERLQQADTLGKDLLSKKMKLLIIMLSLVIIILLLPLASDHGLPLLKPMGASVLQRLWDAMRFIAMTAAVSVGIISTSSQRDEGGSSRSARLRLHKSSTPVIASSSREPINSNLNNSPDIDRYGSPNLSVDRGVNDSRYQTSGVTEMGSLQKSKGKELMDDFSSVSSSSESYGLERSPANYVQSVQRARSSEQSLENLKPRPTNSRHRLSASDASFLASRIDEEIEDEGKSVRAKSGKSVGGPRKRPTSIDNKKPNVTDDYYAELRMRKAALSMLANESEGANGKGHHQRSSSVDRPRRPIHYDDHGPDRPGLKRILIDVSKERSSKGKLPNVMEQSDRPHIAPASVTSDPYAVSTPSSWQSSIRTCRSDSGVINMEANQILQKQSDNKHPRVIRSTDDYQVTNQARQNQDQAINDHDQRMKENERSHKTLQRHDDHQTMVGSAQIKQKQYDPRASMGFSQNLHEQAETRMAVEQTLQAADGRMGPHQNRFQATLHKPNMSSRSNLLLQNSKHSKSDLNLEQLEQKVHTMRVRPLSTKLFEKRKSFSYDFGDGINPDLLWELEPPPPPGFMDEGSVRTCPNREADHSSFLLATPRPNEASAAQLVQDLVPWRTSTPIDISAYPPRTPSPLDPLSQGTGPSSSEVNQRAQEFISNFTTKLLRQRQESMQRRRQWG